MTAQLMRGALALAAALAFAVAGADNAGIASGWQEKFDLSACTMATKGRNPYFVLEPGHQLVLEGGDTRLHITVLNDTKEVAGVVTRIVEEKEWKAGKLYEVARNYFAICEQTKDIYYFGEEVDFYEGDRIVKHDGSWLAGVNGNRAGLMMPGTPKLKMRYYQEIAPGIAMDRAEVVSMSETCKTPAGTFQKCLKTREGSALDLMAREHKYYAPDIGLVRDDELRLTRHGFVKN